MRLIFTILILLTLNFEIIAQIEGDYQSSDSLSNTVLIINPQEFNYGTKHAKAIPILNDFEENKLNQSLLQMYSNGIKDPSKRNKTFFYGEMAEFASLSSGAMDNLTINLATQIHMQLTEHTSVKVKMHRARFSNNVDLDSVATAFNVRYLLFLEKATLYFDPEPQSAFKLISVLFDAKEGKVLLKSEISTKTDGSSIPWALSAMGKVSDLSNLMNENVPILVQDVVNNIYVTSDEYKKEVKSALLKNQLLTRLLIDRDTSLSVNSIKVRDANEEDYLLINKFLNEKKSQSNDNEFCIDCIQWVLSNNENTKHIFKFEKIIDQKFKYTNSTPTSRNKTRDDAISKDQFPCQYSGLIISELFNSEWYFDFVEEYYWRGFDQHELDTTFVSTRKESFGLILPTKAEFNPNFWHQGYFQAIPIFDTATYSFEMIENNNTVKLSGFNYWPYRGQSLFGARIKMKEDKIKREEKYEVVYSKLKKQLNSDGLIIDGQKYDLANENWLIIPSCSTDDYLFAFEFTKEDRKNKTSYFYYSSDSQGLFRWSHSKIHHLRADKTVILEYLTEPIGSTIVYWVKTFDCIRNKRFWNNFVLQKKGRKYQYLIPYTLKN